MNNFFYKNILFLLLFGFSHCLFSQDKENVKQVEIIHSDVMEYEENVAMGANRLMGNVIFFHDEAYMFCDSAYFFQDDNSITAYNNVRITRGDTMLFLCNKLDYNGNDKIALMRDSVILKHNRSYLLTNFLDYDRNTDIAYYYNGGTILDTVNKLTSKCGYYYVLEKNYFAVDSVVLKNPNYNIYSDTLKYNTESEIADFFGPTHIISDSNYMYCEKGFYDTKKDIAASSKNPWLRSGSNYLRGDSLFYDRKIRFGECFKNVSIIDTNENIIAKGDYGYYYENPENAMLTENTLLLYITDENDTVYLHSDTVRIIVDTLDQKLIKAYYKVQIFKKDIQARCDSITFYTQDSIVRLFYDPIIWAEGNKQAKAEYIYGYFCNKEPKFFYLDKNAFVIEQIDNDYYNQISCDNIKVTVTDNQLDSVNCFTNVKSIYYIPEDEESSVVNQSNWLTTENMTVYVVDKKLDNIWIFGKSEGYMYPLDKIPNDKFKLEGFIWLDYLRPKTKEEIFIWKEVSNP